MVDDKLIGTGAGASGEVDADFDDDPTWQHSTVPVSQHAANNGSHAVVWMLGMPSPAGFSENVTAWQPLRASRCTSAAASCTSNSGRMPHGMKRSEYAPHHSSTCQSLYALIITRLRSRSGPALSTWPEKPVKFGKLSPASWPPADMSRTRSCTS